MQALSFPASLPSPEAYASKLLQMTLKGPGWFLVYTVEDTEARPLMTALARAHPGVPIFGATSFRGCFSKRGFSRDSVVLVAEQDDELRAEVSLQSTTAQTAAENAKRAAREIERRLGAKPHVFLLHATPGYEERILEGIRSAVGAEVPVYGGSAADDDIAGRWSVFANGTVCREGFVLIGLVSPRPIMSGFVGGYLPTGHSGVINRAAGRTVYEIDGRPAAAVYNEWTAGAIAAELAKGGSNILLKTSALPVARSVGENFGMPRRLLSHPHEVGEKMALNFFSEFSVGERITLMTSSTEPLITRVRGVVERARRGQASPVRGGLLIYCAGCLGLILDQAAQIASEFQRGAGQAPFIGSATFGEQGCFFEKAESRHGNLMCSVLLF